MNTTSSLRTITLWVTLGSFGLAALLGIIALLLGDEFGGTQVRVLATTFATGVLAIGMLCYLGVADTPLRIFGLIGTVPAGTAYIVVLLIIWDAVADDPVWRVFGVAFVLAATLAQVCLLMALRQRKQLDAVLWATVGLATIFATMIIYLIVAEGANIDDWYFRLLGVVGILDALGTISLIAVGAFAGRAATPTTVAAPTQETEAVHLDPVTSAALNGYAAEQGISRDEAAAQAIRALLEGPRQ